MKLEDLPQPTPEQCGAMTKVAEDEHYCVYAIWYPQMGGYGSRALVQVPKPEAKPSPFIDDEDDDPCFDVCIWHDGQFPFSDDGERKKERAILHHYSASQFVRFGDDVLGLVRATGAKLAGKLAPALPVR